MNLKLEVTNEAVYNEKVRDYDLSGLTAITHNTFRYGDFGAKGDLGLDVHGQGWQTFSGEHGPRDYEEEYGFILVQEEE